MKIRGIAFVEDCLDGSLIRSVTFDAPMTADVVRYLCDEATGPYQYLESFARPFYKIDFVGHFLIEGIQDRDVARVYIYRASRDPDLPELHRLLGAFDAAALPQTSVAVAPVTDSTAPA